MDRIEHEKIIVGHMIDMYCHRHHGTSGKTPLCPECEHLLQYARRHLDRCPHQVSKPACRRCPIHCYAPAERQQIRVVMRYAGPRMLWRHPLATLRHLLG